MIQISHLTIKYALKHIVSELSLTIHVSLCSSTFPTPRTSTRTLVCLTRSLNFSYVSVCVNNFLSKQFVENSHNFSTVPKVGGSNVGKTRSYTRNIKLQIVLTMPLILSNLASSILLIGGGALSSSGMGDSCEGNSMN